MTSQLMALLSTSSSENATVELLNANKQIVAALFLKDLCKDEIVLTSLENQAEKFFIYYKGLGIFFSYFRRSRS